MRLIISFLVIVVLFLGCKEKVKKATTLPENNNEKQMIQVAQLSDDDFVEDESSSQSTSDNQENSTIQIAQQSDDDFIEDESSSQSTPDNQANTTEPIDEEYNMDSDNSYNNDMLDVEPPEAPEASDSVSIDE